MLMDPNLYHVPSTNVLRIASARAKHQDLLAECLVALMLGCVLKRRFQFQAQVLINARTKQILKISLKQ
jgi:hypothetical protein